MMPIDPEFPAKIYLDLDSLEASPDTIHIVDGELRLRACNCAWTSNPQATCRTPSARGASTLTTPI